MPHTSLPPLPKLDQMTVLELREEVKRTRGLLREATLQGQPNRSEARDRMHAAEAEVQRLRKILESIALMPPHEFGAHANIRTAIRLAKKALA